MAVRDLWNYSSPCWCFVSKTSAKYVLQYSSILYSDDVLWSAVHVFAIFPTPEWKTDEAIQASVRSIVNIYVKSSSNANSDIKVYTILNFVGASLNSCTNGDYGSAQLTPKTSVNQLKHSCEVEEYSKQSTLKTNRYCKKLDLLYKDVEILNRLLSSLFPGRRFMKNIPPTLSGLYFTFIMLFYGCLEVIQASGITSSSRWPWPCVCLYTGASASWESNGDPHWWLSHSAHKPGWMVLQWYHE